MPKCAECGKVVKNAFAMKIHVGRMHKSGKAPKAKVAKPVTTFDVDALDVHSLVALKERLEGHLAALVDHLRAAGVLGRKSGRKPRVAVAPVAKPRRKPGRKAKVAVQAVAPKAKKRKKRGVFKVTGEQMILDLLAGGKSLTTAELGKAWKAAGRGGKADNPLTKLVKAKKVKRAPNKDGQGSSYTLA